MASFLRPKRGKKKTATDKLTGTNVLVAGELFMEVPEKGVGKGPGKIKMGDGISDYKDLPYFIDPGENVSSSTVEFTEASETDGSTACTYDIKTKSSVSTLMTKIAGAIRNFHTRLLDIEGKISNIGLEQNYMAVRDISVLANTWQKVHSFRLERGQALIFCSASFGHRSGVNQDLTTRQTLISFSEVASPSTTNSNMRWTSCAASSDQNTICNSILYVPMLPSGKDTVYIHLKQTTGDALTDLNSKIIQASVGIHVIYL